MFTVDTRGKGVVAFQNVQHPNHWITIKNDETTGTVSDVVMMSLS